MTPEIANAFWDAGFCDIDMPDENGVTPFLQSWYCANFKMVDWFAQRGVSMKSKHESASLTALHLYAKRLYFPGTGFGRDVDAVPTNEHYMDVVQRELRIPYDDCQCTCSVRQSSRGWASQIKNQKVVRKCETIPSPGTAVRIRSYTIPAIRFSGW